MPGAVFEDALPVGVVEMPAFVLCIDCTGANGMAGSPSPNGIEQNVSACGVKRSGLLRPETCAAL